MWYIESGDLKGASCKDNLEEAFIDLLDLVTEETGRAPELGLMAVASKIGYDFEADEEALFFVVPRILIRHGKPVSNYYLPSDRDSEHDVLDSEYVDAPNSREDYWPDVISEEC